MSHWHQENNCLCRRSCSGWVETVFRSSLSPLPPCSCFRLSEPSCPCPKVLMSISLQFHRWYGNKKDKEYNWQPKQVIAILTRDILFAFCLAKIWQQLQQSVWEIRDPFACEGQLHEQQVGPPQVDLCRPPAVDHSLWNVQVERDGTASYVTLRLAGIHGS